MVLLVVWNLQVDASCLPIQRKIKDITGKSWSLGSIFGPLERLERKHLLESCLTEPTKERGGRILTRPERGTVRRGGQSRTSILNENG